MIWISNDIDEKNRSNNFDYNLGETSSDFFNINKPTFSLTESTDLTKETKKKDLNPYFLNKKRKLDGDYQEINSGNIINSKEVSEGKKSDIDTKIVNQPKIGGKEGDKDLSPEKEIKKPKPKYRTTEHIITNIKRDFNNSYLNKYLNEKLKGEIPLLRFKKLPKCFIKNIKKPENKKLFEQTLISIFISEDFYGKEKPGNYYHNFNVIETLKKKNHEVYNYLITKNYSETYKDYLYSDNYKNNIIKIREKHKDDIQYCEKFIKLSKNYPEYFFSSK